MVNYFLSVVLFCSLVSSATAASWYVDKDATGGADGTAWADAWTNFSSVTWGVGGVVAGDTLYISGGTASKTYSEQWEVDAAGATNNPITLRVGQDASHNGLVIFDYDSLGDSATGNGVLVDREWITLDGEYAGVSHWVFANLRNTTNRSDAYSIGGYTATGFEAKWLTFSNANHGIRISSSDYTKVYNCAFYGVRGDAAITLLGDENTALGNHQVYSNTIHLCYNTNVPPGASGAYSGPDGIQADSGASIFRNIIRVDWNTNVFTSTQHPDSLQIVGHNMRVYDNEFINVGDSAIDMDMGGTTDVTNIVIYNNVFRIEDALDLYPELIRLYGHSGDPVGDVRDVFIVNNTFSDENSWVCIRVNNLYNADIEMSGNRIQNNIFVNCGDGVGKPTILLDDYTNYTASDWTMANNVYYHATPADAVISWLGTNYTASAWVSETGIELNSTTNQPFFVAYTPNGEANNFRLSDSDTAARNAGADLSAFFTTDITGKTRTGDWDIGAYEYGRVLRTTTLRAGTVKGP